MRKFIPIVISFILLFLAFHNTDLTKVVNALFKISPNMILVSFAFTLLSLFFKMKRWKTLLSSLKKEVSNRNVFSSMVIGLLGNQILPARAGEFISAYLLGRKEDVSKVSVFGTVIMERLLDIVMILLISGIAIYLIEIENQLVQQAELVGLVILLILGLGIFLFLKNKTFVQNILLVLAPVKFYGKLTQLLDSLSHGLSTIKSLKHFSIVFFWTSLMWFSVICAFLPLLYAFDYGVKLPVYTVFVLLLFVTFGMAIPSAPGGIGIYEYASYLAMQTCLPFEVANSPENLAQIGAFSILSHFALILPEIFLGLIYFLKEDTTWDSFYRISSFWKKDR